MDVDIRADWSEAQRARQALVEEQHEALFEVARSLARGIHLGQRVAFFGGRRLRAAARYGAQLFATGGALGQGRRLLIDAIDEREDLAALSGAASRVLWLTLHPTDDQDAAALLQLRRAGARVCAIAAAPGELIDKVASPALIIPTRHQGVAAELTLSLLHSLYKIISESEALVSGPLMPEPSPPEAAVAGRSAVPPEPAPSGPAMRPWGPPGAGDMPNLKASVKASKDPGPERAVEVLRFRCGACSEVISVDKRHAGQRGQCPYCLNEFLIPNPDGRPSSARQPIAADDGAGADRRRTLRFEVLDGRALFKLEDGWLEKGEHIADVSLSGVGVRLIHRQPEEFEVYRRKGRPLTMALDFPAFSEPMRVKGLLRRIIQRRDGVILGVEFVDLRPDLHRKLERLERNSALRSVRRR